MKTIVLLFSIFSLGCSSVMKEQAQMTRQKNSSYQIISLGNDFNIFWAKAKGLPFDEQLLLWNQVVEKPNQDIYDSIVNEKEYRKNWEEKKRERLKIFFSEIPQNYESYKKLFNEFESTVAEQILKYSIKFPDSKFTNIIYAIPGANFDGRTGEIYKSNELVLAFGIDFIHRIHDDPDVLYSHELFHIYHQKKAKIDEKSYDENGKLTLPLWMEGLAVYVSKDMNPAKGDDKIFMSEELPKVSEKEIKWIANEFLKSADTKAFDTSNASIYQLWFSAGKQLRVDIPVRAGYLLGYRVVKELTKTHSVLEMSEWGIDKAHREVKVTLANIASN